MHRCRAGRGQADGRGSKPPPALSRQPGELLEKWPGRKSLAVVGRLVPDVPVMLERQVDPRPGRVSPYRLVHNADGGLVVGRELGQRCPSAVAPEPVRVHLVADDVAHGAAMQRGGIAPAAGEEVAGGRQPAASIGRHRIERPETVGGRCVVPRVDHQPVHGFVGMPIHQQDQVDQHAVVGQATDPAVVLFDDTAAKGSTAAGEPWGSAGGSAAMAGANRTVGSAAAAAMPCSVRAWRSVRRFTPRPLRGRARGVSCGACCD